MNVLIIDTETTGTDVHSDRIIEVCLQFGLTGESRVRRINPGVPIPAEATKVHGITDADVADCPTFAKVAKSIAEHIEGADVIVGYNVAFDLDIINAELERVGLPRMSLKLVVDVLRYWHHLEPRTLAAAHGRFVGSPMVDAHAASADVAATGRVLMGMLGTDEPNWTELAEKANPFEKRAAWIGPSHHIQWTEAGPTVMFGKHRGMPVSSLDDGFLRWVQGKDFPAHVKEICGAAANGNFDAWIAERYPRKEATG